MSDKRKNTPVLDISELVRDRIILTGTHGESLEFLLFSIIDRIKSSFGSLWVPEDGEFVMKNFVSLGPEPDDDDMLIIRKNDHPEYFLWTEAQKPFFGPDERGAYSTSSSGEIHIPIILGDGMTAVVRIDEPDSGWTSEKISFSCTAACIVSLSYEKNLKENAEKTSTFSELDKALAQELLISSGQPILITDEHGFVLDANSNVGVVLGIEGEDILGKNISEIIPGLPAISNGEPHSPHRISTYGMENSTNAEIRATRVSSFSGNKRLTRIIERIVSDHGEEDFDNMDYDHLTGLPREKILVDRVRNNIAKHSRNQRRFAVCSIDIDGFKTINKKHGRNIGDAILLSLAERLKKTLRAGDTVSRTGGNEFSILINDIGGEHSATVNLIDRIRSATEKDPSSPANFSCSIGMTFFPDDDTDADTLLRHSKQSMHMAKREGGDRHAIFDPESDRKMRHESKTRDRIKEGINNNEFSLYFQPKLDMETGLVVGCEALSRWNHPHLGLLFPIDFIPFIDGSDELSVSFGEYVMHKVDETICSWAKEGFNPKTSLNISPKHLQHPQFIENVRRIFSSTLELPGIHLEFEIVETGHLRDISDVAEIIRECEKLGIHFSVDDFGTGYSSLSYLRDLPAKTLKLDKSFVFDMLDDEKDLSISRAVAKLSEAFGKELVAEGVETKAHAIALSMLGYSIAQGYAIARPMPPNEFKKFANDCSWTPIFKNGDLDSSMLRILRALRDIERCKMGEHIPHELSQSLSVLRSHGFPLPKNGVISAKIIDDIFSSISKRLG